MKRHDVVVIGAGPNGLSAAAHLARDGYDVHVIEAHDRPGGGTRTYAFDSHPNVLHDHCSAIHPFGVAAGVFADLGLERHGLEWAHPPIALAHPLPDQPAGVVHRDLARTAAGLGADAERYLRIFRTPVRRWDDLRADLLGPLVRVPRHPLVTGPFGLASLLPSAFSQRWFSTPQARAILQGVAAHAIAPLTLPTTTGIAIGMLTAGHAAGWPAAVGGSERISDALCAVVREHGATIQTGQRVRSLRDIPPTRAVMFDTTPSDLVGIAGDQVPFRRAKQLRRFRHGAGVFKVDFVVDGPVPWTDPACRDAGTVHLGGPAEETILSEAITAEGGIPEAPFVLVAQQDVADPTRRDGNLRPLWAYLHVPNGWTGDETETLEARIEEFAPGFRNKIVARNAYGPAQLEADNPNLVGGDVAGGENTPWQLVARPRFSTDPYRVAAGIWLCSASTPPGGGVHGVNGRNAARSVARALGSGAGA